MCDVPESVSVWRNVSTDVALLQTLAGLLVGLGDVDRPLRDAPEQVSADGALVAQLLVQQRLLVTISLNEENTSFNSFNFCLKYLKWRRMPFLEFVTEGQRGHRNVAPMMENVNMCDVRMDTRQRFKCSTT